MNNNLFSLSREVYPRQIAVLTFFASITYKIVMLPRYLSIGAPRDFVVGIAVAMLIEVMLLALVYYLIGRGSVMSYTASRLLLNTILLLIVISSSIRLVVLLVETLDYVSSMLFQEGRWLFIILTLMPALGYIAYKGINTIARLGEIVIWAVLIAFLFALIFLQAKVEITNIFPLFDSGIKPSVDVLTKHSLWFGDAIPFLMVDMARSKSRLDKLALPVGIGITYVLSVGFYLLFIAIYGEVAPYIKYAFSNIGIYNSISNLLGGVDFPIVCVWMLMAIVKLSLLLYSVVAGIDKIIGKNDNNKRKGIITALIVIIYMLILSFGISNSIEVHAFATSYVNYVVIGVDSLLLLLSILSKILSEKRHDKLSK